ncbi:hypothetical protein AB0M86_45145 [Streptomyces sp. NPDC051639]|uniref:hypothetical protein n=1 Tax=Streptomyces sp. NPDC051639 TaxID=3155671 RepID=UPI0034185898
MPRQKPGSQVRITTAAWYQEVVGDPDQPLPERLDGRQQELLHAMDNGGPQAIRPLIEFWGLVWKVGPRGGLTVDVPDGTG